MLLLPLFILLRLEMVNGQDGGGDYFKTRQYINPGMPGPWIKAAQGSVWPKPKNIHFNGENFYIFNMKHFRFHLANDAAKICDIITSAMKRYKKRIFPKTKSVADFDESHPDFQSIQSSKNFTGIITSIEIIMKNAQGCETYPHLDMDEKYEINMATDAISLIANTAWGVLRGLETFSQLVHLPQQLHYLYVIRDGTISDEPRFKWRGILIDSSRHFLSKRVILENMDLMEMNKFNVLHWHLTDDNSFPYESYTFPNISAKGAYHPKTHIYTQQDIADIIEYARLRGIRVVPEIDTPGHTQSWEAGAPGVLTRCYSGASPNGLLGPLDPTKNDLYPFLSKLFHEIGTVFPDKYIHLGGDEVSKECWKSNPNIMSFVRQNLKGEISNLESYYISKLLELIDALPNKPATVVYQEIFDNHDTINEDTIVTVWKGWPGKDAWARKTAEITSEGLPAILSAPWYLNYVGYGSDWVKYYKVNPQAFTGGNKDLVYGGEACMWGEFVNSVNLIARLWPRASAVGERLWSSVDTTNVQEAAKRLQEHECRMLQRGYPVEPVNGPNYCPVLWD